MARESTLLQTIRFFNLNFGKIVTRTEFLKEVTSNGKFTRDTYRNSLRRAGFLEITGRGKYKVIKLIPEDISFIGGNFYLKKTDIEKLFIELDKLTKEGEDG